MDPRTKGTNMTPTRTVAWCMLCTNIKGINE